MLINCELVFADVNPYQNQQRIAKDHQDNIMYALAMLDEARTGEITKFVNAKVTQEIEAKYCSSEYLAEDPKKINLRKKLELKQKRLDRKTVQKWLPVLEKKRLVSKSKFYVYSLTAKGQSEKIFGEHYGKILFDSIAKLPINGTPSEKFSECIKLIGSFVSYIFFKNIIQSPLGNKHEWIVEAINPRMMFDWFLNNFKSNEEYDIEPQFTDYINTLLQTEDTYNNEIFPNFHREQIDIYRTAIKKIKGELNSPSIEKKI